MYLVFSRASFGKQPIATRGPRKSGRLYVLVPVKGMRPRVRVFKCGVYVRIPLKIISRLPIANTLGASHPYPCVFPIMVLPPPRCFLPCLLHRYNGVRYQQSNLPFYFGPRFFRRRRPEVAERMDPGSRISGCLRHYLVASSCVAGATWRGRCTTHLVAATRRS